MKLRFHVLDLLEPFEASEGCQRWGSPEDQEEASISCLGVIYASQRVEDLSDDQKYCYQTSDDTEVTCEGWMCICREI